MLIEVCPQTDSSSEREIFGFKTENSHACK